VVQLRSRVAHVQGLAFGILWSLLALVLFAGAQANAATLEWGTSATANLITTTNSNTTTGITVTSHSVLSGSATTATSAIVTGSSNGSAAGTIQLNLDAATDSSSVFITTTFTFSAPVVNLTFTVRDIDGGLTCSCWTDVVDFNSNNGVPTSGTPASGITYNLAAGRAQAQQNTGITGTTGNVTVTWSQPVTSVTVKYIAGDTYNGAGGDPGGQYLLIDDLAFNLMPKLQVNKISNGAVGTFNFAGTNGYSSTNITTTVAGGTTTSAAQYLTALNTATNITETPAAGFVLGSFTCTGLGAGTATRSGNSITISAAAIIADASIICTFTNERATVKLQKITVNNIGTFTFTQTNLTATPGNITTVATGTATPASPTPIPVTALNTAVTLTEPAVAGFGIMSATCSDANAGATGNPASFGTLAGTVLTIPAINVKAGSDITCTFTNGASLVRVQKSTLGGSNGPFTFSQSNLASAPANITTSAIATPTPAAPTGILVSTIGTAVTVTEGAFASYRLTAASCTDANSATTGNVGAIGTLAGSVLTIPAGNVKQGADFTCVFSNSLVPTVKVQKVSIGGFGGTVTFTQTNLTANPGSATTTAEATPAPAAPTATPVSVIGTAVSVTEVPVAGYAMTTAACGDANSAVTGAPLSFGTFSGNVVTIPASRIVAGADITCTLINLRPRVAVQKTTVGGFGGPFAFTQTNLVATPGSITTVAAATPTPAAPTPINVTTVGTAVTINEPAVGGFFITGATCSDLNAAVTGNPASFGTLTATTLTIPATNIRAGADIRCVVSNTKGAPSLQVLKTANTAGPLIQGQTVTYTYQITNNGNVPVTGITVADMHNGSGAFTGPNSEALVTDNAPAGDTTDASVNASWDVLGPGDVIRFSATYVVTLNDIETLQ
jgi:hypothetical protein